MDSILKDPKWNRGLSEEEKKYVYDKTITYAKILEGSFLNIIQKIRNQPFQKPSATSRVRGKRMLVSRDFLWTIEGNIAEMDKTKIVTEILDGAKKAAVRAKAKPSPPPPPKPIIDSCVTYFYPPIWIGKLPQFHSLYLSLQGL